MQPGERDIFSHISPERRKLVGISNECRTWSNMGMLPLFVFYSSDIKRWWRILERPFKRNWFTPAMCKEVNRAYMYYDNCFRSSLSTAWPKKWELMKELENYLMCECEQLVGIKVWSFSPTEMRVSSRCVGDLYLFMTMTILDFFASFNTTGDNAPNPMLKEVMLLRLEFIYKTIFCLRYSKIKKVPISS